MDRGKEEEAMENEPLREQDQLQEDEDAAQHSQISLHGLQLDKREKRSVMQKATAQAKNLNIDKTMALREARGNKCNYILGLASCILAVALVATMNTLFEYTPLLFLSIAEYNVGEMDVTVLPSSWTSLTYLNYSNVRSTVGGEDVLFNYSSPRWSIYTSAWNTKLCNNQGWNFRDASDRYLGKDGSSCGLHAESSTSSCVAEQCGAPDSADLYLIDSYLEERMGLGSHWHLEAAPPGSVYLHKDLATMLNATVGSELILQFSLSDLFSIALPRSLTAPLGLQDSEQFRSSTTILLPVRVSSIFEQTGGKFNEEATNAVVMEYGTFIEAVSKNLNPNANYLQDSFSSIDLYEYAQYVCYNLPPPRSVFYMKNDYSVVQTKVLHMMSRLVTKIGFEYIDASIMLLGELRVLRTVSIFLGLIISIIIVALVFLLCLLMYSLLIISVENRAFDLGVLRMVGMTRRGVIRLLLLQTFLTSIPGWAIGLLVSKFLVAAVLDLLKSIFEWKTIPQVETFSIQYATVIGLLVPAVAVILPIRKALSVSLTDALDIRRNKVVAVKVSLERASQKIIPTPLIVIGSLMTMFGVLVYYMFPLALLTFNLTLLLYIFFALLMGILAGLVLLSMNIERPVEYVITNIFFWWSESSMRTTLHKNLIAHRTRNRKTTLMYSLSLAFVVFVIVLLSMQIEQFKLNQLRKNGSVLAMYCPTLVKAAWAARQIEEFVQENRLVEDFALVSHSFRSVTSQSNSIRTLGRVVSAGNDVYAVTPNFFKVASEGFLTIRDQLPSYFDQLTESIYSAMGSQSMLIGSLYMDKMAMTLNSSFLLQLQGEPAMYERLRPMAFLDGVPKLTMSRYPARQFQDAIVSFPTFARLVRHLKDGYSVRDIPLYFTLFKLKDGLSQEEVDEISDQMSNLASDIGCRPRDVRNRYRGFQIASDAMGIFSSLTTGVALIVSFFSLVSSMFANIQEQAKELGLLRAIGVTRNWIARLYTMEATVLVLSSALLGLGIGAIVASTVTAQQTMFTQLPLLLKLPPEIIVVILLGAVGSACLSSYFPARRIMQEKIVKLLKAR
uniref:ABC3 transporter permease C-terminal domain-containing protein n=1 Tax=Guillardia theta TaxID=55529 RepID=A0A7S4JAS7_GUITH|mmetsp:Transcript_14658/g.50033  ORF Transcript_14658/g.50033 Transcript_14658/m.50033 type:complete len:1066 (+) Transcript_14658:287-3484(+)